MIIKVNDEYVDFYDAIQIEKQSRLFESIDFAMGDFSYRFNIPFSSKNNRILTYPNPDVTSKKIYKNINCELQDIDGMTLYTGFLRVERPDYENKVFICSFFSGNNNWIGELSGLITNQPGTIEQIRSDIDLSEFDTTVERLNIQNSWTKTDGVLFPFFDTGNLITRSHGKTVIEDWSPCMFVKTLFNKIMQSHSIKVEGELMNDWLFNNIIFAANTHDQNEIDDRTCSVAKDFNDLIHYDTQFIGPGDTDKLQFDDDSFYPYFNSPLNNFDLPNNQYVVDTLCRLRIELRVRLGAATPVDFNFRKNGSVFFTKNIPAIDGIADQTVICFVSCAEGDIIDFTIHSTDPHFDIFVAGANAKIGPIFMYSVKGKNIAPKWTQQQFVKNVLSLFNVVTDFDPYSKTLTINFFDRVKDKPAVELPDEISIASSDYIEFISSYGKSNYFGYQSGSDEDVKKYNVTQFIKYGQGGINVKNDFLQPSIDYLTSDFTSPISYINKQFGSASLERTNIFEFDESDQLTITSVADNGSGTARFSVDLDLLTVGDLVKIEMNLEIQYNGQWVVSNIGTGYFEVSDIRFQQDDTGKATLQITKTTGNDNVYLFVNTGARVFSDFSASQFLYIQNFAFTTPGYCYFNLLNINKPINTIFKQGLSFGSISNNLSYQKSILDTYWTGFSNILNDPAKIYVNAYLPKLKFLQLSPLNPVFIRTVKTNNLYYMNRTTGYEGSTKQCILELIKL